MSLLNKLKSYFKQEDNMQAVEQMKIEIGNIKKEYEELIILQEEIKNNPYCILKMNFSKKEKYIDIMEDIKFKDVFLIKEYQLFVLKYNILIELYKKLSSILLKIKGNILFEFKLDAFNQTVAVLSPFETNLHKILLVKNTFFEENYLNYEMMGKNIIIKNISLSEPSLNNVQFLVEMLSETAKTIGFRYEKIVLSKGVSREYQKLFCECPNIYVEEVIDK